MTVVAWVIEWLLRCRATAAVAPGVEVRCRFVRRHGDLIHGTTTHEADNPLGGMYRWWP